MTNADKIRNMTDEELAMIIMCPYDTAGKEIMPCILDGEDPEFMPQGRCFECTTKWLKKEATQEQNKSLSEDYQKMSKDIKNEEKSPWKNHVMQRFIRSE